MELCGSFNSIHTVKLFIPVLGLYVLNGLLELLLGLIKWLLRGVVVGRLTGSSGSHGLLIQKVAPITSLVMGWHELLTPAV